VIKKNHDIIKGFNPSATKGTGEVVIFAKRKRKKQFIQSDRRVKRKEVKKEERSTKGNNPWPKSKSSQAHAYRKRTGDPLGQKIPGG